MSNENAGNPDVLNFPRDTTLKETNLLLRELIQTQKKANNLDVLSLFDGTVDTYRKVMKEWFDARAGSPKTLTTLCNEWYDESRASWHGYTDFLYTGTSAGTKDGDNANLSCTPSTDTDANTDDYAGLPLFVPTDCNWTKNPDTLEIEITAIRGITPGFELTNPEKFVGVLQQGAWVYQVEGAESWRFGYCSHFLESIKPEPMPETVRIDKSIRPWMLHSKYPGKVASGKWQCYSGVIPTAFSVALNTSHTISAATGAGISGICYCDIDFLRKMMMIKYGSLTLDGVLQGCVANDKSAKCVVSETGVKRLLLASNAAAFEAGMGVLVGAINSSGTEINRSATNYNISGSGGCVITAVETVTIDSTEYKAVYVDVAEAFDTVADTTCICTFHWPTGSCDKVLGNDGSPKNPGTGVYPAKIQGIEFGHGGLPVLADTIVDYTQEDGTYYHQLYFVNRTADQSTSLTSNYKPSGVKLVQPNSAKYDYIKHMKLKNGVFVPSEYGGSSSTYFRDANYILAETIGLREYLAIGGLNGGTGAGGVSYAALTYGLTNAAWAILGGPSPNGDRGEWPAAA